MEQEILALRQQVSDQNVLLQKMAEVLIPLYGLANYIEVISNEEIIKSHLEETTEQLVKAVRALALTLDHHFGMYPNG